MQGREDASCQPGGSAGEVRRRRSDSALAVQLKGAGDVINCSEDVDTLGRDGAEGDLECASFVRIDRELRNEFARLCELG